MKLKLLTLNILHSGRDQEYGDRTDYIIEVINAAKPDFVALQEADGFEKDDSARLQEISERIGLLHCDLSLGTPRPWDVQSNVASFSRYPFKEGETFKFPDSKISGGALLTVIDSPIGELAICNLQLDAYSEEFRLRELTAIWQHMSVYERQILIGDLNSISTNGHYDPKTIEVEYRFVVTNILQRSHVDVAAHLEWEEGITFPTPISKHPVYTRPLRIDYGWVSPSLADHVTEVAVIRTPDSEQASDHRPLELTLALE